MNVLEAHDIAKSYRGGDGSTLHILNGANLTVKRGEMVAIVGESGAGKSTLLHVIGALDRPTSGYVMIGGESINDRSDDELAVIRNKKIGFVFQYHHLLREFSALENVMMPLRIQGVPIPQAQSRATELLLRVGLGERMHHRPSELRGGEQQRVAIARALANKPTLLLADEPTGELDAHTGEEMIALFERLNGDGTTIIVVTHDEDLARAAHRVVHMRDGVIVDDRRR